MKNLKKILIVCTFFVALALLAGCASGPAPEAAATEAPTRDALSDGYARTDLIRGCG